MPRRPRTTSFSRVAPIPSARASWLTLMSSGFTTSSGSTPPRREVTRLKVDASNQRVPLRAENQIRISHIRSSGYRWDAATGRLRCSGSAAKPANSPASKSMPHWDSVGTDGGTDGGPGWAPAGVMRPIRWPLNSVNHRVPSDPAAMPSGPLPAVKPVEYSVMTPAVVMRPIRLPLNSVNHRAPSDPAAMALGLLPAVRPVEYSVMTPAVVMRPIRLAEYSVNHRAPSGPGAIPGGRLPAVRPVEYSVMTPAVVMRPIRLPLDSVNHRAPSGDSVNNKGPSGPAPIPKPHSTWPVEDYVM